MNRSLLLLLLFVASQAKAPIYEMPGKSATCPAQFNYLSAYSESFPKPRALPAGAKEASELIAVEIFELVKNALPADPLHSLNGSCIPCSSRMQLAMARIGLPTQVIKVEHGLHMVVNGQSSPSISYHFFGVLQALEGREEIIIDSTYLQFIAAERRQNHPLVFIGTRSNLEDFFVRNQDSIRRPGSRPGVSETIDPREFVMLTYGYDRAASTRR